MRKVVSGAMLTLLFLVSLTSMSSVQVVNAEEELPIVWEAVYDEGKSEFFSNVAVDSNGNLMVVGNVINYATGEAAGIVAKYSRGGELLWLQKVQPYPFTNLNGIAVDPNDNIVAFGVTSTNPDMQDYGGSQIAEWLIAKFYPNGTLMWQTYYRKEGMGYHREGMYGIVAYDDNIICTGVAGYQFRVIKLDINGSLLWETQPSIGAQGNGMAIDKNGDIFVVGQTSLYPYSDVVLVKLSQSGNELWAKVFDWGGNEVGKDIEVDWDGNIIIIGGEPLFVLKLNSTGDTIWRKEYPRTGYDCWNLRVWPNRYGISTFSGSGTSPPYYVEYDFGGNLVYEASFRGGSISADKQGRLTSAYLKGTWPDVNATLTVYDYLARAWAGTVYIRADGSIDPPDAPIITYDNVLYTLTGNITSNADGIVVERSGIFIDGAYFTIEGMMGGVGVYLLSVSNVKVKNFKVVSFRYGIWLQNTSDSLIAGNIIVNNYCGMMLNYSSNNVLINNNITDHPDAGIRVNFSSNNLIYENNLIADWNGIRLLCDSNNTIQNNTVSLNWWVGIGLTASQNAKILENNVVNNRWGIYIEEDGRGNPSINNTVYNNFISNNDQGIRICSAHNNSITQNNINRNGYGIYLERSLNNKIYHNNFKDNTQQAYVLPSSINTWDDGYPSGGNYWSDYVERYPDAKELDSSGLWDMPYVIDENNRDRYPLMYPYGTETYKLTITTTFGGTTNPSPGIYTYVNGTQVVITAIPNNGFSFDYWLLDGVKTTQNPITIIMNANHTLVAYFVDDIPPEISEPWQDPPANNVQPLQNVTVCVNVTDYGTGIKNVTLWYSLDNGTSWTIINMTALPIPSDTWVTYEATIRGYENCTWVTYKIVAYDNSGNNATKDNNGYGYKYHVIPEFSFMPILMLPMLITLIATTLWKTKRKH